MPIPDQPSDPVALCQRVELRQCSAADAPALALIGGATLLESFAGLVPGDALLAHCRKHHTTEAYFAALAQPDTRAWMAEVPPGAAPVGYAIVTEPDFPTGLAAEGDLELRRIYIFSRFHGNGVGRRMIDLAIGSAREQHARHLLLGVHPYNHRALAFYRKTASSRLGFVPSRWAP